MELLAVFDRQSNPASGRSANSCWISNSIRHPWVTLSDPAILIFPRIAPLYRRCQRSAKPALASNALHEIERPPLKQTISIA